MPSSRHERHLQQAHWDEMHLEKPQRRARTRRRGQHWSWTRQQDQLRQEEHRLLEFLEFRAVEGLRRLEVRPLRLLRRREEPHLLGRERNRREESHLLGREQGRQEQRPEVLREGGTVEWAPRVVGSVNCLIQPFQRSSVL